MIYLQLIYSVRSSLLTSQYKLCVLPTTRFADLTIIDNDFT